MRDHAQVYVINSDTPEDSFPLWEITKTILPVLLDQDLSVARFFDFLPKPGQPMGGMSGVAQMGFVVIAANGTIRVQRVAVNFGDHAGQILDILDAVSEPQAVVPPAPTAGSLDTPHQWYPYIG
ncbi:MAG: hypothetical protein M3439_01375 [Chloroflexota bacterium]|nr:hypothetical protein [Chloroflexota bacterium]